MARLHTMYPNDFELSNISEQVIKKILPTFSTSKAQIPNFAGPNSSKISEGRC